MGGGMMKCVCGYKPANLRKDYTGKKALGQHCQRCDTFWQSIRQEMERISIQLRNKVTPVSAGEWYMHRGQDFPTKKTLIDWCGSWSKVLKRLNLGMNKPGPRTSEVESFMPFIDEFIETILDLSDERYGTGEVMGGTLYDACRPAGWPTYRPFLRLRGYEGNAAGWRQFFRDHGLTVISAGEALRIAHEAKSTKQAQSIAGFDYRNPQDEKYIALMNDGFAICQATYKRTGRMVLR